MAKRRSSRRRPDRTPSPASDSDITYYYIPYKGSNTLVQKVANTYEPLIDLRQFAPRNVVDKKSRRNDLIPTKKGDIYIFF